MQNFWMVWREDSQHGPVKQHATEADALAEAKRLATSNPGGRFYVLETVKCVELEPSFDVTDLKEYTSRIET